ncbi:MAG: hypothetical protein UU21_C0018G0002 [Candidatus Levybacteria bacterium GW2011_GWA2_40_8]|nr:MAG: hypothetical protein UU21_C0018G0002 [Candidatus Levybacteria bacterium GW2011_GWA2_40_8]
MMKKQNRKFPSIYRSITDKENAPLVVLSAFIIVAIFMVGLDLNKNLEDKALRQKLYESKTQEIKFWEENLSKYPEYRDAYFRLAVLYYEVGNFGKSESYLNRVFLLDPSFEEGKELEKLLKD